MIARLSVCRVAVHVAIVTESCLSMKRAVSELNFRFIFRMLTLVMGILLKVSLVALSYY